MDTANPILTEPGVKYFLDKTLKNCRTKKDHYNNKIINFGLFLILAIISGGILYYKYRTRPTEKDRNKIQKLKRDYFVTKVRQLEAKKAKQLNAPITNLPIFESPFELLHKNFFKT